MFNMFNLLTSVHLRLISYNIFLFKYVYHIIRILEFFHATVQPRILIEQGQTAQRSN